MKRYIYGTSVRGAAHKHGRIQCQDSCRVETIKDVVIMGAADGHGSTLCPYSKTGSVIAVNVFCSVMSAYYNSFNKTRNGMRSLMRFLNREGSLKVAQSIDLEWKRRVYKQHLNRKREVPADNDGSPDKEAVYKMYGSTLLGLMITKSFIFAFQLGDGDICCINGQGINYLLAPDKLLGVETHSLCKKESWKKAVTQVSVRDNHTDCSALYWMSTDGMSNSYRTQKEFEYACTEYYSAIRENGFEVIEDNLDEWLEETSEQGCGDDVTVVMAYYYTNKEKDEDEQIID